LGSEKRKILIVEDDKDIRETLSEYLQNEGFDVTQSANGKEAVEKLDKDFSPCLILLDLFMPVMNGNQFLEIIKKPGNKNTDIPVLVFSAAPTEDEEVKKVKKWVSGVLKKPFDIDEVLSSIKNNCH
jgi:CheY-like chemotaxis protein